MTFTATPQAGEPLLHVQGQITLRCLSDEWTSVTTQLPWINLASASLDGQVVPGLNEAPGGSGKAKATDSQQPPGQAAPTQRTLLVRGKGTHQLTCDIYLRLHLTSLAGAQRLNFQTTRAPAQLQLTLPPEATVFDTPASYSRQGNVVTVLLHSSQPPQLQHLHWRIPTAANGQAAPNAATGLRPDQQSRGHATLSISDHAIETTWDIEIVRDPAAIASDQVSFSVSPPSAIVLAVESPAIASWQQNGERLTLTTRPGQRSIPLSATLRTPLDLGEGRIGRPGDLEKGRPGEGETPPSSAVGPAQAYPLPTLQFTGPIAQDYQVTLARLHEGVALLALQQKSSSSSSSSSSSFSSSKPPAPSPNSANPSPTEDGKRKTENEEATTHWNPQRHSLHLLLRKSQPRITVDADTHARIGRDNVNLTRTLTVQTDSPINQLQVTLPPAEEFESTASTTGPKLDWQRSAQTLTYTWPTTLRPGNPAVLELKTRLRIAVEAQNSKFEVRNSNAAVTNPDFTATNPGSAATNPDFTAKNPGLAAANPDFTAKNPGSAAANPDLTAKNPGLATTNPDFTAKNPGLAAANPGLAAKNPGLAAANPDLTAKNPGSAAANPDLAAKKPDSANQSPTENGQRKTENAQTLTLHPLAIPAAQKLAGYLALDHDPAWRLTVTEATGLEERDARLTPVTGALAWFTLREHRLGLSLQRREPVIDAAITAYALPRARSIDIEGQLSLTVSQAPLRTLVVAADPASAPHLRFTSPQIAQQTLDPQTSQWTLTLRQEVLGQVVLRYRVSLGNSKFEARNSNGAQPSPAPSSEGNSKSEARNSNGMQPSPATSPAPANPPSPAPTPSPSPALSNFEFRASNFPLPTLHLPSARRQRGVWVIEANTDTQLSFQPQAMQPLDVLRAPAIDDYQPRHRVVAAFDYLPQPLVVPASPSAPQLQLTATRHAPSELAALVISQLQLTSVLGPDGSTRHQASLAVQHSGEQFLTLQLPPGSELLSLIADGEPVKPVRGTAPASATDGSSSTAAETAPTIAIPLPPTRPHRPVIQLRLLYETPAAPWSASGSRALEPPRFAADIPVQATDWAVYAPEGYSFKKAATTLQQSGTGYQNLVFPRIGRIPASSEAIRKVYSEGVPAGVALPAPPEAKKKSLSQLAERETVRRAGAVEDSSSLIEQGDAAYIANDFQSAAKLYQRALDSLPEAPTTKDWRSLAMSKLADATIQVALEKAKAGSFGEARSLVQTALMLSPSHKAAIRLRDRLQNPETFNTAEAAEFREQLLADPFNIAARRGMERDKKPRADSPPANSAAALRQKLQRIILPRVSFADATIAEAIEYLRLTSRDLDVGESDSTRQGVNIILGPESGTARITLDLKDVTLEEALRYVVELAGMKYKVEPFAVLVVPISESTTEQFTRIYKVPPDFLTMGGATGKQSAKETLIAQGIPFPEGASAVFNPANSQLIVKNTQPNLDLVETLVESLPERAPEKEVDPSTYILNDLIPADELQREAAIAATRQRLQSIILPSVAFVGASLTEAVGFIQKKLQEAAADGPTPKLEMNAEAKATNASITLDLKDVPMEEALRYVVELAGAKYKLEPTRVLITPIGESTPELLTRVYAVPADHVSLQGQEPGNDPFAAKDKQAKKPNFAPDPKAALLARDIPFPGGAFARFDASKLQLTVRNTEPSLDIVEMYLQSLWQESSHTPPRPVDLEAKRRREEDQFSDRPAPAAAAPGGPVDVSRFLQASKAGLLTLDLELPKAGRWLHFHGAQAPEVIELRYVSWERQLAWAVALLALGAVGFLRLGRARPWLLTALVVVLLGLGTGLLSPDAQPAANALLLGWLAAAATHLAWGLGRALRRRFAPTPAAAAPTQTPAASAALGLLLLLAATLCPQPSLAGAPATAKPQASEAAQPDPAAHQVYIPYDPKQPLTGQTPARGYLLDREDFERLWAAAKENRKPALADTRDDARPEATLVSALYRATLQDERVTLQAQFTVHTRGRWASAALPLSLLPDKSPAPLREVTLDGRPAAMKDSALAIEQPGVHTVLASYEIACAPRWTSLHLALPPARAALLHLSLSASDGMPVINNSQLVARLSESPTEPSRVVTAVLGSHRELQLQRTPRRPSSTRLPPSAEVATTVLVGPDLRAKAESTLSYAFPGTAHRQLSFAVDKAWDLVGVEANAEAKAAAAPPPQIISISSHALIGGTLFRVSFAHEQPDQATLKLTLAPTAADLPSRSPQLHPDSQKVQTTVTLAAADGAEITPAPRPGQTRLAAADFDWSRTGYPTGTTQAYRLPSGMGILPITRGTGILPVTSGTGVSPATSGIGILPVTSGIGVPPVTGPTGVSPVAGAEGFQPDTPSTLPASPDQTLAFTASQSPAHRSATADYVFQLSEQKAEVSAAIVLTRQRGEWTQASVEVPPGMEIQSVLGPQVARWQQVGSSVFLHFTGSAREVRFVIDLASPVAQQQRRWQLSPFTLPGIEKVSGTAIIAAHKALETRLTALAPLDQPLAAATTQPTGLTRQADLQETDPSPLTSTFTIAAPLEKQRAIAFQRAHWVATAELQPLPVRFSADTVLLARATDEGLQLAQQLSLSVEQGALRAVRFRLPAALPEAVVTGEQLRETHTSLVGDQREYECSFQAQGGLLGWTTLTLAIQLPVSDAPLDLPFIQITEVERLRRYFVIDNASHREGKTLATTGVESTTRDALPYLPEELAQPQFYLGTETAAAPAGQASANQLRVAFTQLQATEGNAAIITLADIHTTLRPDGERWDSVTYTLHNRSLQFLPIALPDRAELIAVTVSGEPVRADEQAADKAKPQRRIRLIPLIQTRPGQRSMEVRLVYRLRPLVPGSSLPSQLQLDDPELIGLSAERTLWSTTLPHGHTLAHAQRDLFGNMEPIAEDSRQAEHLQGMLSDLARINRYLSLSRSSGQSPSQEDSQALAQAQQLWDMVCSTTKQVEQRASSFYRQAEGDDNEGQEVFKTKLGKDLQALNANLATQTSILKDNNASLQAKQQAQQAKKRSTLSRTSPLAAGSEATLSQSFVLNGGTLDLSKANAAQAPANALGLSDNVGVNSGFFALSPSNAGAITKNGGGTLTLNGGTTLGGVISGTALTQAGAGTLAFNNSGTVTLNGSNTYSGTTIVSGGILSTANTYTGGTDLNGGNVTLNGNARGNRNFASNTLSGQLGAVGNAYSNSQSQVASNSNISGSVALADNISGSGGKNLSMGQTLDIGSGSAVRSPIALRSGAILPPDSIDGLITAQPRAPAPFAAISANPVSEVSKVNNQPHVTGTLNAMSQTQSGIGYDMADTGSSPSLTLSGNVTANSITAMGALPARRRVLVPPSTSSISLPDAPPAILDAPDVARNMGGSTITGGWSTVSGSQFTTANPSEGKDEASASPPAPGKPTASATPQRYLTAQAVNQLRPTGRRSLLIDVPADGPTYHFRKLKDHAHLSLDLRPAPDATRQAQATTFGIALALLAATTALQRWRAQRRNTPSGAHPSRM